MVRSGRRVDLSGIPGTKVGKHSTGGVGDKVSIVLAPVAAACGVVVPKMSGRGLGPHRRHARQARSDPGFRVALSIDEFLATLARSRLLPDQPDQGHRARRQDALRPARRHRDHRKHPADLRVGDEQEDRRGQQRARARRQVRQRRVHEDAGRGPGAGAVAGGDRHRQRRRTEAFITAMDAPLGGAVGNALEIAECVDTLRGPRAAGLEAIVVRLAARMVQLAGRRGTMRPRRETRVREALASGAALAKFAAMIARQGGDRRDRRRSDAAAAGRPAARRRRAARPAICAASTPKLVGRASMLLGAGREKVGDTDRSGRRHHDPAEARRRGRRPANRSSNCITTTTDGSSEAIRLAEARNRRSEASPPGRRRWCSITLRNVEPRGASATAVPRRSQRGTTSAAVGLLLIAAIAVAWSTNRRAIRLRTVAWGFGLQLLFAVIVLKTGVGQAAFQVLGDRIRQLLEFSTVGAGAGLRPARRPRRLGRHHDAGAGRRRRAVQRHLRLPDPADDHLHRRAVRDPLLLRHHAARRARPLPWS